MTFNFEPTGASKNPDESWAPSLPTTNPAEWSPDWRVQSAYNILWTWEELTAFADGQNACFLAWLQQTMKENDLEDIILPCLMTEMEWNGPSEGGGGYPRPSLLLLHGTDKWFEDNSIPLCRPDSLPTEAFRDGPEDCTIDIL